MLRASNIVRARIVPTASFTRTFTTTPVVFDVRQKEGKKKQVLKKKVDPNKKEVRKTTSLTHLPFRDAVRNLGLNKNAPVSKIEVLKLGNLQTGSMTSYPKKIESKLNIIGGFKRFQHHEMFDKPVSMITSNTTRLDSEFLEKLNGESKNNRIYIDGVKGSGKSTLVNQAITLAYEKLNNDVIVLHLDSGELIGNGSSDYIKNNKLKLYQQPMLTKRWIWKIMKTNEEIFKKLKLTKDTKFIKDKQEVVLKAGENTLFEYLKQNHEFGRINPHLAFQYFIEQLVDHSKEIPVLLSIDNFNAFADYPLTKYKHPDFTPIHINEFELGDFILKASSGELNFTKGGVLLAKSNDFALNRKTTHVGVYPNEEYDPYLKLPLFDFEIANRLASNGGISPFKMNPLTKDETRSLMKFWKEQGVLIIRQDFHKKLYDDDVIGSIPELNQDEQFEKMVQLLYVNNQGNPYGMIKQSMLSY